jgi:nucleoid-associated protein YgaU
MFTAMISRYHLLIALPALALALGVGWAAFELGRGRFADLHQPVTRPPASEQPTRAATGPETQAPPSSAADAGAASASGQGADAPAARSIDQPDPAQTDVPRLQAETAAAVARRPSAEADGSTPGELTSASPHRTEPPAPPAAAPQAEPADIGAIGRSSVEDEVVAAAPAGGGGVDEQTASPDRAPARAAVTDERADSGSPAEAPPQPTLAAPARTDAARSEPDKPAAQPDADETVALAVPRVPERAADPAPSPSAAPSPADRQAVPDEPGADEPLVDETARVPERERPIDEPRSAPARAAETVRRALATLFGGATDKPAPPRIEEPEVAAVPPATSDKASAPGELEPSAAPSFDIVRIGPGGRAVIAGRAAPGAEVEIRSGDRLIDRVRADRRGEWVAVPPEPLDAGVQELSLAARVEDQPAIHSEEVVVLGVPEPPPPEIALGPLEELPLPARVSAAELGDEAFAVAVPRGGAGGGRILQAPGRISGGGALALVMLDYDDAGRIRLSGEATPGSALRIYVDNEPAGVAVVGPGGRWDTVLEHTLTPGDYMLRLDQLGESGKPDARLETPFTRVSQPPVAGDVQVDYVIVQPGNSLWRIARRVLGEGMRYVHIYEANQAQIRDPDLIYPGQVFELPSALEAAG